MRSYAFSCRSRRRIRPYSALRQPKGHIGLPAAQEFDDALELAVTRHWVPYGRSSQRSKSGFDAASGACSAKLRRLSRRPARSQAHE